MSRFVAPVTLTGAQWVVLEPLTEAHTPEIAAAAADGDGGSLWFTTRTGTRHRGCVGRAAAGHAGRR
jgi:hypothetical protein